jgi:hypothetical protein
MTSSMQAPNSAASALNSSSDVLSQLMLSSLSIIGELEIVGTVAQCGCGSPKCDGGSAVELLSHELTISEDSTSSTPTFLVESRAEAPALLLSELEIREASVVTDAVYSIDAPRAQAIDPQAIEHQAVEQKEEDQQPPQVLLKSQGPSYYSSKPSAFNPFNTWL